MMKALRIPKHLDVTSTDEHIWTFYRKYKYRLAIAENEDEWLKNTEQPLLWQFAERPYMWFLPNGFDVQKAADACSLFQVNFYSLILKF